ncbi:MAG: hypothetical protein US65_C0053G0009 [Candidatus Yanofskybacteria bacterium GW2011_GWC2_37_9]|uniref:Uncharacterized protein n=1 Tax=Candidatus Yanofskybacteria bacterium GW2011_GWC2_37_9 TaxID=1619028 RepID=A0A0G0HQR4_9BACT|nr:MAG: hypothetical protein US65_C0053G0009 [Candidatus Yanofskybacteria bacterium GW2011_GWC2_37_9]
MLSDIIKKSIAIIHNYNMFRIFNLKFGICLVFSVSYLVFSASVAHAALIIQAPKYIGLTNGLVGYWSFDGKDMAGNASYDRLKI